MKTYLVQSNERIWQITKPELKRLMTDIAQALEPWKSKDPSGVFQTPEVDTPWWTDVIRMEDYAVAADDILRFDFDEEFDPWEEVERFATWKPKPYGQLLKNSEKPMWSKKDDSK